MKKLTAVFAILLSLVALPPLAGAKDKDKDKKKHESDEGKKEWKETRDQVRELQAHSDRLQNTVRTTRTSRSVQQNVAAISGEVNRVCQQFESGKYDRRELNGKISILMNDMARVRQQIAYDFQRGIPNEDERRGGYDSKRRGGYYDR